MDPFESIDHMEDEDYFDHEEYMIQAMALHRQQHATEGASASRRRNSQPRMFIRRNPLEGHERLWNDYFAEPSIYPPNVFRRRFRMHCNLFLRIHSAVEAHDDYFVQKRDASGRLGLSSLQKITEAIRMLAYGVTADLMDEYVRIGESTKRLSMKKFVKAIVSIFGGEYLRSPTNSDIARLLEVRKNRGFLGMLGSIDCMYWKWKNCPSAWKGMYSGHVNELTIILEAVASYDLWIWHAFFGLLGSHNDINVLDRSSIFATLAESHAPPCNYTQSMVTNTQWDIILLMPRVLKDIMYTCIILHNMIVEDERHQYLGADQFIYESNDDTPHEPISRDNIPEFMEFIAQHY
ncbi:uncharacterized protein LOC108985445 [Juglans regia]|uniref:Uncharacterized protein LOC108985445 n=1 Tax=Juglans regia TaxID=51240 RepID=A0A6P9DYN8_JUGRE|nr:uncharacterized protein LOC108985445 [Juglans regia]